MILYKTLKTMLFISFMLIIFLVTYCMYLNSSNLLLTKSFKWRDQHIISILDLREEKSKTMQYCSPAWCHTKNIQKNGNYCKWVFHENSRGLLKCYFCLIIAAWIKSFQERQEFNINLKHWFRGTFSSMCMKTLGCCPDSGQEVISVYISKL